MVVDQTSLLDLAIFHAEEDQSVLNKLNFCQTDGGRAWLKYLLSHPFSNRSKIEQTQQLLRILMKQLPKWPGGISNGTIMVLERYLDSQVDTIPHRPGMLEAWSYKIFHAADYSLTRYTVGHLIDFVQGMQQIADLLEDEAPPPLLQGIIDDLRRLLQGPQVQRMLSVTDKKRLPRATMLGFGQFMLTEYKEKLLSLIELHSRLDAYASLARAMEAFRLQFPEFIEDQRPYIAATSLYHILLTTPVPYTLEMSHDNNFIFLTGANMAGKSTFIKSVGLAVYLAHIGMGVPAASMQLTLFHGLLSNIQVSDNIAKGESYFFNEVQRIKHTILRINDGNKWLVLIDELFKGTNVQDAMRCSSAVIKGLLKIQNSLFILSTHLYEIGEELKPYPNIAFRYFETTVTDEQLSFSYQLKEGVSNDRLGYLILKREGVVDMIEKL